MKKNVQNFALVSTHSITNGYGKRIFTLFGQFLFKIKLPHNLFPSISGIQFQNNLDNIIIQPCGIEQKMG